MQTKVLSTVECAFYLDNMSAQDRLVISASDFRPVATMWAQANAGKTLWLDMGLRKTSGNTTGSRRLALESSIRGKLKGTVLEIFQELSDIELRDGTLTIRLAVVEVRDSE